MKPCPKWRNRFVDVLCNDLDESQRHEFESHIENCTACRSFFLEMQKTTRTMSRRIHRDPGPVFWNGYWESLADKINHHGEKAAAPESRKNRLRNLWPIRPVWTVRIAAAVGLVVIGIFVGRLTFQSSMRHQAIRTGESGAALAEFAALNQRAQNYLQKSKILLMGLVNFDSATEDTYTLNLPYQKRISENLIQEAGFLKERLSDPAQNQLRRLISDLEFILLQIANLESAHDLSAIEMVRSGADRRGILLKINLEEMRQTEMRNSPSDILEHNPENAI